MSSANGGSTKRRVAYFYDCTLVFTARVPNSRRSNRGTCEHLYQLAMLTIEVSTRPWQRRRGHYGTLLDTVDGTDVRCIAR
jgi:hypothetical protein